MLPVQPGRQAHAPRQSQLAPDWAEPVHEGVEVEGGGAQTDEVLLY